MSVARLAARLRAGELTPRDAVEEALARIEELDGRVNAYVSLRGDDALAEADALGAAATRGPLWGVPLGIKDVIDVAGVPTTACSRVLGVDGRVPERDATVVARLRRAGAIVLGKLNTHEFAYGALTTSSYAGPVRNPWESDRVCGGSSGGSGAAAAAGLGAGALGTDTAGSVRIPACFCGVTGLRPTWGLVSNAGVVPVSWSYDTVGPLARTAEDCALLLDAIAGADPLDPATAGAPVQRAAATLRSRLDGVRVGIVRDLFDERLDARIAAVVGAAVAELRNLGADLVDVEVPFMAQLGTIQQATQFAEATSYHLETMRSRLGDYDPDVRARLLTGLFLPATVPVLGQRARRLAADGFARLMEQVDLLAAPTMPVLPPRIGEDTVDVGGEQVPYRLTVIPYNSPWSCVGAPCASVPCGFVDGLPVGLALVGRRFGDARVLQAAHAFQEATDWHERRPPLHPA